MKTAGIEEEECRAVTGQARGFLSVPATNSAALETGADEVHRASRRPLGY